MGIGAFEETEKLTLDERKKKLADCYHQAVNKFNAKKNAFIPDIKALIDACEMQKMHWTQCDFNSKETAVTLDEHAFLQHANEEKNIAPNMPDSDYYFDIKNLYGDWQMDLVICSLYLSPATTSI